MDLRLPSGVALRGSFLWTQSWGGTVTAFAGPGFAAYNFSASGSAVRAVGVTPTLRAGLSFQVHRRIGLGLFANYDLRPVRITANLDGRRVELGRLGGLALESTIGLRF